MKSYQMGKSYWGRERVGSLYWNKGRFLRTLQVSLIPFGQGSPTYKKELLLTGDVAQWKSTYLAGFIPCSPMPTPTLKDVAPTFPARQAKTKVMKSLKLQLSYNLNEQLNTTFIQNKCYSHSKIFKCYSDIHTQSQALYPVSLQTEKTA